jgi:hypothetical protein
MPKMRKLRLAIVGLLTAAVGTSFSALGHYSHGTAVLALPTGNQIVFAADSAEMYGDVTTYQKCKITKVDGKTIFTQSGVGGIGRDIHFSDKAAELLKATPIHTQQELMTVATRWNLWVIQALNASIKSPDNLTELSSLSPVEAIFATVDDNKRVVLVTSRFDIVNVAAPTNNMAIPNWVQNLQIQNSVSPGDKGSQAFGLRYGDLQELREQQTDWSHKVSSNAGFKPLLASIDQPGDAERTEANAEAFMTIVASTSNQDNGTFAVGGETDIILLRPTGASWVKKKSVCPETWGK